MQLNNFTFHRTRHDMSGECCHKTFNFHVLKKDQSLELIRARAPNKPVGMCACLWRETLVRFLFPGGPVCGGCFPGVGVHAQCFEISLAGVLVMQLRASGWSLSCHQLTIEKVLGDAPVFHAADVAQPSHASLV